MEALGFLEVMGYAVAVAAMDEACKKADIQIIGVDSINPKSADAPTPLTIQVKFTGDLSSVIEACEAAREFACRVTPPQDVISYHIPSPFPGIEKLAGISKVKVLPDTAADEVKSLLNIS